MDSISIFRWEGHAANFYSVRPTGPGSVSSLDLLSASGMVNYFGKWTDLTRVEISPLLMQKGVTRLALYGLSHLKDERLARLFGDHRVTVLRPRENQEEWCSVFVLHQNRVDRGPKSYIAEEMLPAFLDLVIWGHEHECKITPDWNDQYKFYVYQPGSTVATSLCDGEAADKHVAILSIYKRHFRITPVRLKTVRPFVLDTIVLADCRIDFSTEKPSDEVQKYVTEHIETLIDRATYISGDESQMVLPLIRLRVQYSEEKHLFNAVRFGLHYTGRVANPSDMVVFHKLRSVKEKTENRFDKDALENLVNVDGQLGLTGSKVQAVVERYFAEVTPDKHLKILSVKGLAEAASRFVDKDDKDAIFCLVDHQIKKTVDRLLSMNVTEEDIDDAIENFRQERLLKAEEEAKDARAILDHPSRQTFGKKTQPKSSFIDSDSDSDVVMDQGHTVASASHSERGRGRGTAVRSRRGRGSRARGTTSSRGRDQGEAVVQTSIRDAFSQRQDRRSSHATSSGNRSVIFVDDSDD
ncbi:double-strand break repair protein MRE11 isoform X2 [Cryptotermes secundus]|uniref:double-strand break repair protein MRE11 isoform X2 n=1 Tax=Cryptotermes secundus TaxID=105785 RepID=UPI001454CA79|nr:double-strand break repair protein MRE11 isoform X2 [Cryptotermes secundus]